jgi:hypothetical protein
VAEEGQVDNLGSGLGWQWTASQLGTQDEAVKVEEVGQNDRPCVQHKL